MKFVEKSLIISNSLVNEFCYRMVISSPKIAKAANPGQFLEIGCGDYNYPLLKRPISILNIEEDLIEIIYYVIGKGTNMLSKKEPGDLIEIVGPLGNGYSVKDCENHILVGGGYGAPPMVFLANKLLRMNKKNIFVCLGSKTKDMILCKEDFLDLDVNLCLATEDGSLGKKGFVTDIVKTVLDNNKGKTAVYSCGPTPMMENLYKVCREYENVLSIQCAMESVMACGIGVCNGCVIKVKENDREIYKRVCTEGPVFEGAKVVW